MVEAVQTFVAYGLIGTTFAYVVGKLYKDFVVAGTRQSVKVIDKALAAWLARRLKVRKTKKRR